MSSPEKTRKPLSPLLRWGLLLSGFIAVVLGVIGIFLPVLPTVPFLLLAAACFARSSDRFFNWLVDHAHLGPMVKPYLDGNGLRAKTKIKAIMLIWVSIAFSIYLLEGKYWIQAILILVASGVSIYLVRLPTLDPDNTSD